MSRQRPPCAVQIYISCYTENGRQNPYGKIQYAKSIKPRSKRLPAESIHFKKRSAGTYLYFITRVCSAYKIVYINGFFFYSWTIYYRTFKACTYKWMVKHNLLCIFFERIVTLYYSLQSTREGFVLVYTYTQKRNVINIQENQIINIIITSCR